VAAVTTVNGGNEALFAGTDNGTSPAQMSLAELYIYQSTYTFGVNFAQYDAAFAAGSSASAVAVNASTGEIYEAGSAAPTAEQDYPTVIAVYGTSNQGGTQIAGTNDTSFNGHGDTDLAGVSGGDYSQLTAIPGVTPPVLISGNAGSEFTAIGVYPAGSPDAGDVLAAGAFSSVSNGASSDEVVVARFLPTGALDTTFGTGGAFVEHFSSGTGNDVVSGLAIGPSGTAYIVGSATVSGSIDGLLIELDSTGTPVSSVTSSTGCPIAVAAGCLLATPTSGYGLAFTAVALAPAADTTAPALVVSGTETKTSATSTTFAYLGGYSFVSSSTTGVGVDGAFNSSGASPGSVVTTGGTGTLLGANSVSYVSTGATTDDIAIAGPAVSSNGQGANGVALYLPSGAPVTGFGSSTGNTSTAALAPVGFSTDPSASYLGAALMTNSNDIIVAGPLSAASQAGGATPMAIGLLTQAQVSISGPATVSEPSTSPSPVAQFTVSLIEAGNTVANTVTVGFATADGSAVAGTDYTAESGTITFSDTQISGSDCGGASEPAEVSCTNDRTALISVPILDPPTANGTYVFSVTLSSATGASIGTATASATIDYTPTATTVTSSPTSSGSSSGGGSSSSGSGGGKTTTPTTTTTTTTTLPPPKSTIVTPGKGYWVVTAGGVVQAFGDAPVLGSVASKSLSGTIVGISQSADGKGYWLASSTGHVYGFGDAHVLGQVAKAKLTGVIVAIRASSDGRGYYLVSSKGTVYAFGDARGHGSIAAKKLVGSVVACALTAHNDGYLLVTSTGNVYAFGNAHAHGSVTAKQLVGKIVGITTTSNQAGYWLASSTGHVYAFGNAHLYGQVAHGLAGSVTSLTPTPDAKGYWLVTTTGKVYSFGDAAPYGSDVVSAIPGSVAGFATSASATGFWLASTAGEVSAFGRAAFRGAATEAELKGPLVGFSATPTGSGYYELSSQGEVIGFGSAHAHAQVPKSKLGGGAAAIAASPLGVGYWVASGKGAVDAVGTAKLYPAQEPGAISGVVRSLAPIPSGKGYLIATSTGHVYAYGGAHLAAPVARGAVSGSVVSLAVAPGGSGYWLATSTGRVYAYGTARDHTVDPGSAALTGTVRSIVATPDGGGYWLVTSSGAIAAYGDASSHPAVADPAPLVASGQAAT